MLTIFDYLRRRAFESVIAGVQEAVESLNRPAQPGPASQATTAGTEPQSKPSMAPRAPDESPQFPLFNPDRYLAGPGQGALEAENLPPRRRPGRPRNNGQPE